MRQLLGSSSFGCKRQGLKEMDRSGCPRAFWILARTAPPAHPGQDSSDESSEDMGEGTSEGGIVLASASISQLTIPVTDMSVGPVSGEASGSLSGEHDTSDNVHWEEEGTSEASGMWGPARGEDSAAPRLHAGPLRSLLPQLLEMQQQSQAIQEGLTATLDQLRGCCEESQSFQESSSLICTAAAVCTIYEMHCNNSSQTSFDSTSQTYHIYHLEGQGQQIHGTTTTLRVSWTSWAKGPVSML
ncbi:uncharacterized protein LOC144509020 isoform X1 [Mustelus asterias]